LFNLFVIEWSLEALDAEVQKFQQNAFALGTKGNLKTQFKAYLEFCTRYELPGLPATGETLCRFATWTAVTKRAKTGQTVRNFLSAVRTFHKLLGQNCPTPKTNGKLELTVRGLNKLLAKAPRRMYPITKSILVKLIEVDSNTQVLSQPNLSISMKIYQQLFGNTIKKSVYKALYLTLFLSFLRISSLIPESKPKFDKKRQLIWKRVSIISGKGIILKIIKSKTIQDFSKTLEVPIGQQSGSDFCVVGALRELTKIPGYPCGSDDPVFNIPDMKGGWEPLTKVSAGKHLESKIMEMGLNPKKYRWHGFRRGGIQHGSMVVSNLELLRIHGGWESECFRVYMDLPATSRFQVTQKMLDSLSS